MAQYLTLLFPSTSGPLPTLKKWLVKMGTELRSGDALLVYQTENHEAQFQSPISGVFKVTLWREGDALSQGKEIAVLSAPDTDARHLEEKGLGKILTPEEYKSTLEHADAASIRLPPEPTR